MTKLITLFFPRMPSDANAMGTKGNVVLYLDKELVAKSKSLGFNLSKTFENHLKHLITRFSQRNTANNFYSTSKNVSWCGRRDLNPGSQAWKACVLNQLDDDRHSDTIVLETKKAIDATLTLLTNDGQKPNTVRHIKYKLQELAAHVDLFNPEAVKHYAAKTFNSWKYITLC
jgi:hypothetical protein